MNLPDIEAPETSVGTFLKLKDGESIKAIFVGEMHTFHSKWIGGKSVITDNKDPDGRVRIRSNLVILDPQTNELVTKVWEFAWKTLQDLKAINEEYPLETIKVKITRDGLDKNTKYTIIPLVGPKDTLSKSQLSAIANMPLHDLTKKSQSSAGNNQPPAFDASDDIPF